MMRITREKPNGAGHFVGYSGEGEGRGWRLLRGVIQCRDIAVIILEGEFPFKEIHPAFSKIVQYGGEDMIDYRVEDLIVRAMRNSKSSRG